MKTLPTHLLRLLTMIFMLGALSSCKLPPRYAMREIQSKGLLNYLGSDYSSVSPNYYASAAPFQLQRPYAEPRPVNPIPYRSTYQTNRNLKADYNRVPYRPKSVTRNSPPKRSRIDDDFTPAPTRTTKPSVTSKSGTPEKPVATAPKTSTPASPEAVNKPEEVLPYGTPVAGRPGMVVSPYTDATKKQLVDVTGLPSGEKVKDPYSGKLFRVPPTQQAANQPSAEKKPAAPVEEGAGAKPKP